MDRYNTILFDLDDTILDFTKGEGVALNALFKEMNIDGIDSVINDYRIINQSLWHDLENGKVTRDYVLNNRFFLLFKKYGKIVDGEEIELRYR
jgi:2-haloacid dehalogenase